MSVALFTLVLALSPASPCSIAPGWVAPTLEEQMDSAGMIIVGEVEFTWGDFSSDRAQLRAVKYYKGCGPNRPIVGNFRPGNLCGPGSPVVGGKYILFACEDSSLNAEAPAVINSIDAFTGVARATPENLSKLEARYSANKCASGKYLQKSCKKKRTSKAFSEPP